jgi:signal peptidase II
MQIKKKLRTGIILLIVMCNISCDQITKVIVREKVDYNERIELINNHFTLTKIENSGAFLSMGDSLPLPIKFLLLSLIPLIALTSGFYFVMTRTNISKPLMVGICFVIGGGIGNLFDRIIYGSVTDFLHLNFVIFQTGIFNMADVSIMIGMFIILVYSYLVKSEVGVLQKQAG